MKRYRWCITITALACFVIAGGNQMFAAEQASFQNSIGVIQCFSDNPKAAVAVLEKHITQLQADAIEADLFPSPEPQELLKQLMAVHEHALRVGLPPNDEGVADLKERIDTILIQIENELEIP